MNAGRAALLVRAWIEINVPFLKHLWTMAALLVRAWIEIEGG